MNFCYECGTKLISKDCGGDEGIMPFCIKCSKFRFPVFNAAIITTVFDKSKSKVVLLQQYGKKDNILLAGYITKGETAEHALIREVKEEIGLEVINYRYIESVYSKKSNTLMIGYMCIVKDDKIVDISTEVDKAGWFLLNEAKEAILKNSIAEKLLSLSIQDLDKL